MRPLNLTLFLALIYSVGFGQSFKIDSLPTKGILLDKNWKWHAGDNPDFAKADFDDSKWESIDPTLPVNQSNTIRNAKIGWFRLKLIIDSSLVNKPLTFNTIQASASEIFINGLSVNKLGVVSPDEKTQIEAYSQFGIATIFRFSKSGENIVAVRYSLSNVNWLLPFKLNGKTPVFRTKLLHPNGVEELKMDGMSKIVTYYGLLTGIFAILSVLHFIFYRFYQEKKTNLTFAIALFFGFLHFILSLLNAITNSAIIAEYYNIISTLAVSIFIMMIGFLLYQFFNKTQNTILWIISTVHIISAFFLLSETNIEISYSVYLSSIILLYVFCIIVIIKEIKNGHKDAKSLLITFILLIVYMLLRTLFASNFLNLGIYNFVFSNVSMIAFYLCIPITFAVLLAKENAHNSRTLQSKIIENEQLAIEKQQILASQNETLERQVEERTAQLKASQAQLIQAEKLASLGELTAGIAHEIQNPLNFVNNFSELSIELIEEAPKPPEGASEDWIPAEAPYGGWGAFFGDLTQNLEKINHHGKRASSIVKGMLEHSRSSSGTKELTDINKLADEYLRLSYHGLRAKDKSFNSDFELIADPNLPKINVIPQDIGRVLLNLINNAFQSPPAPRGGDNYKKTVTVRTCLEENNGSPIGGQGGLAVITISDNGSGIPADILPKIFQPFFTTKPTGQGTGLGLSLAYDIITKGHGGTIEVESIEGEGTTFTVKLPI